jgi:hypothetical protein
LISREIADALVRRPASRPVAHSQDFMAAERVYAGENMGDEGFPSSHRRERGLLTRDGGGGGRRVVRRVGLAGRLPTNTRQGKKRGGGKSEQAQAQTKRVWMVSSSLLSLNSAVLSQEQQAQLTKRCEVESGMGTVAEEEMSANKGVKTERLQRAPGGDGDEMRASRRTDDDRGRDARANPTVRAKGKREGRKGKKGRKVAFGESEGGVVQEATGDQPGPGQVQ